MMGLCMNFAALTLALMALVIELVATPGISQTDEPQAVKDAQGFGTKASRCKIEGRHPRPIAM